jgi:pyruvoyl-dependent arginine decarboxylase (PvlArgDC)
VDWKLVRLLFVGGDIAFDVMAHGESATAGGTISARVGFVL